MPSDTVTPAAAVLPNRPASAATAARPDKVRPRHERLRAVLLRDLARAVGVSTDTVRAYASAAAAGERFAPFRVARAAAS
jgi:hypothetical protein